MAAKSVASVTLELEPGETIRGRLLDAGGAEHRFHGWLELSAAIERAWERAGGAPAEPASRPDTGALS